MSTSGLSDPALSMSFGVTRHGGHTLALETRKGSKRLGFLDSWAPRNRNNATSAIVIVLGRPRGH